MSEKDVSDEQLLEDIRLTQMEADAYWEIKNGYSLLSKLPENIESGKSRLYRADCEHFLQLYSECSDFLAKLNEIKNNRGL
jgi:hypothetical protein